MIKFTGVSVCSFFLLLALFACQPEAIQDPVLSQKTLPTKLPALISSPKPTNTHVIPTATFQIITPLLTATPIASVDIEEDLDHLVRHLYTWWSSCIGYNFAKETSGNTVLGDLEFVEVNLEPDAQKYWVSEIADNVDESRRAFVLCDPAFCQDKIYFVENGTKKVYEISWEARMPWRSIDTITWIDNDILAFHQSISPERSQVVVIDVSEEKYLYYALIFPDYFCSTATSTP